MRKNRKPKEPESIKVRRIISRPLRYDWGQAETDGTITLNKSLRGYRRLLYLAHEAAHLAKWSLTEEEVRSVSTRIARVLWKDGYRKEGEGR